MDADRALDLLGGVARRQQLERCVTPAALRDAVERGVVVRVAHGRYALPGAAHAPVAAARLGGTLAGPSAAQAAGWELARPPDRPWVAVPRHRARVDGRGVHLIYSDERESDPLRIVVQCARRLPFPEGLAVADSAVRSGQVDQDELVLAAARMTGPGSRAVRTVAAAASPLKANPLESCLHGLALTVPGLDPVPQAPVQLGELTVHPDLVDRRRRLVIEAEGWLYHGLTPAAFERDVRRYTLLVAHGWQVARFTHQHVMREQDYVVEMLTRISSTGTPRRNRGE